MMFGSQESRMRSKYKESDAVKSIARIPVWISEPSALNSKC